MRGKTGLVIFLVIFCAAHLLAGTDYYVDQDNGNDRDNGLSIQNAWKTIDKANRTLRAGDTVYIRNGTYREMIMPLNSGSPGNYITYRAYPGETPRIAGPDGQNVTCVSIQKDYIKLLNLTIGAGNQASSDIERLVDVRGDHFWIQGCTVENTQIGEPLEGEYARGIILMKGSSYGKVINNTIRYVGDPAPPEPDEGDGIHIQAGSHHNLIEGNRIHHCGHGCLIDYGEYNVVRNNELYNPDWSWCGDFWSNEGGLKPGLWENNRIHDSGSHQNGWYNATLQLGRQRAIVRRNLIYNAVGNGIEILGSGSYTQYAKDARIYHNTIYNNGHPHGFVGILLQENSPNSDFTGIVFKNNIFYNNDGGDIYYQSPASAADHTPGAG